MLVGGLSAFALILGACGDDAVGTATNSATGSSSGTTEATTEGESTSTTAFTPTSSSSASASGTTSTGTTTTTTTTTTGVSGSETDGTTTGTTTGTTGDTDGTTTTGGGEGCVPDDVNAPDPYCGEPDNLVYVATPVNGGSDANEGMSPDTPVATLAKAIEIALICDPLCDVVVSAGTYPKTVSLAAGVDLFGGYEPMTWKHGVVPYEVTIEGDEERSVIAEGLDIKTRFYGFTVKSKSYAGGGASTYAFWVKDVADDLLAIERTRLLAGDAGEGSAGQKGGKGDDGGLGGKAMLGGGGAAGASTCGASGGVGGNSFDCGSDDGADGKSGGDNTAGGAGGVSGKSSCNGCNDSGLKGSPGMLGDTGKPGTAGDVPANELGSWSAEGLWTGDAGGGATRGDHGRGGGGGGAGGFDIDPWFCVFWNGKELGGGGGGGGGAGCGGNEGSAGGAGGGSFGLVAIASGIQLMGVEISAGLGGDGGVGGGGGNGGVGKAGGGKALGGDQDEGGDGADGAGGGDGGGGAGAAGGCGGASVGIAEVGGSIVSQQDVSIQTGSGGLGGEGGAGGYEGDSNANPQAQDGGNGCDGIGDDIVTYE